MWENFRLILRVYALDTILVSILSGILLLGEGKYSPGVEPPWKVGSDRYSDFYKALVNKPDPGVHRDLCKVTRSQVCEKGGLACSREGSRVYFGNQDRSRCS